MDWLSPRAVLTAIACLTLCLPLLLSESVPHARGAGVAHVINLKRTPGGSSRGGSSASRDEIRARLSSFRQSVLKGLGGLFDTGQPAADTVNPQPCSLQNPDDILHMLPGRFLSEDDLIHIVPETRSWVSDSREASFRPQRRLVTTGGQATERAQFEHQPAFDIKPGTSEFIGSSANNCGHCLTEIGYEIVDQVVDFSGQNHTVINFKNAYQFIPSGRCVNENIPCGLGGSRCRQITRAHWSLVWTAGSGVSLVAHEVPSHCECLNLGSAHVPLRSAQTEKASSRGADVFRVAGLKMDGVHEDFPRPAPSPLPIRSPVSNPSSSTGLSSSPAFTEDDTSSLAASFTTIVPTDTASTDGTTDVTDFSSTGLK